MDYKEMVSLSNKLHVLQAWEGFEIMLGLETRNKYRILSPEGRKIGFAAEQSAGPGGAILRQILGHWRSFKILVFNEQRQEVLHLHFPFRWFLKTLFVSTPEGQKIGSLQQRFSVFFKRFDVLDAYGMVLATIKSPLWKPWTFAFNRGPMKIGAVQKKWSGGLGELFTDKDNFEVVFEDLSLTPEMKALMLSTCLMVDIVYFENNHSK